MGLNQQLRGDLTTRLDLALNQLQSDREREGQREERTYKTAVPPLMKKAQNETHLPLRRISIVQVDRPLVGQKVEDI